MKKVLSVLLAVLVGCSAPIEPVETKDMVAEGYEIKEESRFIETTMLEAVDILENGTGVIYYGYPDCAWCKKAVPELNTAAKQENAYIYYVNVQSPFEAEEYNKTRELTAEFQEDADKYYVPFVVAVKDGKVIDGHVSLIPGYNASDEFTEELKQELREIYKDLIDKTK